MSPDSSRIPRATYRVQLHREFTFRDAAAIVDYLARLGITHLYCSPYLRSRAGSTHGYDVVDHSQIDDEIGGESGHREMLQALSAHRMLHILDIVPNHMAVLDPANKWWWDVLKRGVDSEYAHYFDVDWDPPETKLRRRVLVPILGDHYGRVLERGEICLERAGDEVIVRYYDNVLPVADGSVEDTSSDTLARVNADAHRLHEVLEAQHYRLAYWRTAGQELNYRRFFSINELAAVRAEDRQVFEATHSLVLQLVRDGQLAGLRVDHIDGLRRPREYLEHLRARAPDVYLIVEKILEPGEELPPTWPVDGTTGYDFLNRVGALAIDATAEKPLTDLYSRLTGQASDIEALARDKKLLLMDTELATDIERLTDLFVRACEENPRYRDFTRKELRDALRETVAAFPVYRTYVDAADDALSQQDVAYVEEATELAQARRQDVDPELFEFLRDLLLLRKRGSVEDELAMRFQQTTGAVMAKGIEDTLFYVYNRLISVNEVGGDLARFGITVEEFHELTASAARRWPNSMLATSTHDTKRSEDVRARISLLSEIPERWTGTVLRWSEMNERHRTDRMPDRNGEYLLYQTLVGAWPLDEERAVAYMRKATKEAKEHTSWISPNQRYDDALARFVHGVLADAAFVAELEEFVAPLVEPGWVNSLAQTLLKLTAPGVPDVYQGTEVWDLSLVDPDNRRPVDYARRRELLEEVIDNDASHAWARAASGAPKLFVIQRALQLRAARPHAFAGSYSPLPARGSRSNNLVAYARADEVVTVVPRLVLSVGRDWGDTTLPLPPGVWIDRLGGRDFEGSAPVSELFARFPVALLSKEQT